MLLEINGLSWYLLEKRDTPEYSLINESARFITHIYLLYK